MSFSLVPTSWIHGERRGRPMSVLAKYAFCLAFGLGIILATQSVALADRRIALVIGNGKYENAGVLANPINDADAVADLFTKAGFDVVDRRRDLGVVEFKRAVREFVDRAANADVAVVYYSGHGLEIGGRKLPHSGRRETDQRARHGRRGGVAGPNSYRGGSRQKAESNHSGCVSGKSVSSNGGRCARDSRRLDRAWPGSARPLPTR